jgi:hypothetical protein
MWFAHFTFTEEGPFVTPLSLTVWVSVGAVLVISAVYIIWSRQSTEKADS